MAAAALLALAALAAAPVGAPDPAAACLRVLRPLGAGVLALRRDFAPVACSAAPAGFRYDPALGLARTRRALAHGDVVRAPPRGVVADVAPGDHLILRASLGAAMVERPVDVVRAAPAGRPVLVRAADGEVFLAPAPTAVP